MSEVAPHTQETLLNAPEAKAEPQSTIAEAASSTTAETSAIMDTPIDKALGSGAETLGVLIASIIALITVIIILFVFSWMRRKFDKSVTIALNSENNVLDFQVKMWHSLSSIKSQYISMRSSLPSAWLLRNADIDFGKIIDPAFLGTGSVDFKFGDAELKGFDVIIRQFLSNQNQYVLRLVKSQGQNAGTSRLSYALQNQSGISAYGEVEENDVGAPYLVASSIASTLASANTRSPKHFESLFLGLFLLSRYYSETHDVKILNEAARHFDTAAQHQELRKQANILALTCSRLAQNKPNDVRTRLDNFLVNTNIDYENLKIGSEDVVLAYQRAVSLFYTYSQSAIKEAIDIFDRIPSLDWVARRFAGAGLRKYQRAIAISYLAKADAAIAVAHLDPSSLEDSTTESLRSDLRNRLGVISKCLDSGLISDDQVQREIKWRMLNAEAASVYNWKYGDRTLVADAREKASQSFKLSVYCLDPRANEATLFLQEAILCDDADQKAEFLVAALQIFNKLNQTGWDPGYVRFRLAQIKRSQGVFEEAANLIEKARDPAVKVMPESKLQSEADLVTRRDRTLRLQNL